MSLTAVHLVNDVIPRIPMRQWVLRVPQPLRNMLAYDHDLAALVGRRFVQSIFRWLKQKAKAELGLRSVRLAHPGAITAVQRFNSAAQLSVHNHVMATDGVFVTEEGADKPRFAALPAPTQGDIAQVAWETCEAVVAALRKQGRWLDDVDSGNEFAEREPALAASYTGSIQGTLVLGPNSGIRVMRLYGQAAPEQEHSATPGHGFNVHAGVRVKADDKKGLEKLCRYFLRPPLSQERLALLPDGRVQLRLKRVWSDGTSHMVFDALDFLTKLTALIPPPRRHTVRYSGVFAPNSKLRPLIVPAKEAAPPATTEPECTTPHGTKRGWAALMQKVFEVDVLECPRCHAKDMQRIPTILDRETLRKILTSVGLPADSPKPFPPRLPQQPELDFAE